MTKKVLQLKCHHRNTFYVLIVACVSFYQLYTTLPSLIQYTRSVDNTALTIQAATATTTTLPPNHGVKTNNDSTDTRPEEKDSSRIRAKGETILERQVEHEESFSSNIIVAKSENEATSTNEQEDKKQKTKIRSVTMTGSLANCTPPSDDDASAEILYGHSNDTAYASGTVTVSCRTFGYRIVEDSFRQVGPIVVGVMSAAKSQQRRQVRTSQIKY